MKFVSRAGRWLCFSIHSSAETTMPVLVHLRYTGPDQESYQEAHVDRIQTSGGETKEVTMVKTEMRALKKYIKNQTGS